MYEIVTNTNFDMVHVVPALPFVVLEVNDDGIC